ncbi:MAG: hypothetical protein ACR2O4_07905 [Hyphomicrobiaceae bacterium]
MANRNRRWTGCVLVPCLMLLLAQPVHGDDAPTILIEDAVLNCSSEDSAAVLRTREREIHASIAALCQKQQVCRVDSVPLIDDVVRQNGCFEVVIVPVCAAGADEVLNIGASSEMSVPLDADGGIVINCSGQTNPHF